MKKKGFVVKILLIFMFVLTTAACSLQKEVNVKSIEIIESSVPNQIFVGEFDEAGIKALITYEDGSTETIDINSNFLRDIYQNQINTAGEYKFEILFKGVTSELNVKIVEKNIVHKVRFFNAFNELVSLQMVEDGDDAVAPTGYSHFIKGYEFLGWDRTFKDVREDIDIYGVYVKVDEVSGENIRFDNLLLDVASKMKEEDVNVLIVHESLSKRVEQTHYYDSFMLTELVEKVTDGDRSVSYYRYIREEDSTSIQYVREQYDDMGDYLKINIMEEELFQNDIYEEVKKVLTSGSFKSFIVNHLDEIYYKLLVNVDNMGDGSHVSDSYEFLFNDQQIVYFKHFQNHYLNSNEITSELVLSKYYTINLLEEHKMKFPYKSDLQSGAYQKFSVGQITNENTEFETEHFVIKVDKNVYVPGYFLEYIEIIYDTLELVSNLKFYNEHYNPSKIVVRVKKPVNENSPEIEYGSAYAYSKGSEICISSGDLLLGNSYAMVHELAHILMYSQSSWSYSQVYVEGFAEYTSYKVVKYLEKYNTGVAKSIDTSMSQVGNMRIDGDIYSQTIEYWIGNPKEACNISSNCGYAVGFRLMSYLDHEYDDYSRWINYYENKNPYHMMEGFTDQNIALEEQLNAMMFTYGEDVLEGFYSWLKVVENDFFTSPNFRDDVIYDLTTLKYAYIYPQFYYSGNRTTMTKYNKFIYNDLYVSIDETRNYLENYKGKDVSNLSLKLEKKVLVELYDFRNNLLETRVDDEFSLVGVSYIKLVGENLLGGENVHGLEILY